MAMYGADFRAVGGIEDANSGRWGFEDTSFLHKVMDLGFNSVHVFVCFVFVTNSHTVARVENSRP